MFSGEDSGNVKDRLAEHIVANHTKRINGQKTLLVPDPNGNHAAARPLMRPRNRDERRASRRANRGRSTDGTGGRAR